MGTRKRNKPLANLDIASSKAEDIVPGQNGLPGYARYVITGNSSFVTKHQKKIIVFFERINKAEEEKYKKMKRVGAKDEAPLVSYIMELGFPEYFARQVACLYIDKYRNVTTSVNSLSRSLTNVKSFIDYLSSSGIDKLLFVLGNLELSDFIGYRDFLLKDKTRTAKYLNVQYSSVINFFSSHEAVNCSDDIKLLTLSTKSVGEKKLSQEHTSHIYDDKYYDESVMYTLYAQFILDFERRIGFLQEYEDLTEDKMDELTDGRWIRPNHERTYTLHVPTKGKTGNKTSDQSIMVDQWVRDEQCYPIIYMHQLMWHKLDGCSFYRSNIQPLKSSNTNDIRRHIEKYEKWLRIKYRELSNLDYDIFGTKKDDITNPIYHSCKNVMANKMNAFINKNLIGYDLINLIMIMTGVNKEVPFTWESQVDGVSILEINNNLFRKNDAIESSDVEIIGYKNRQGKKKSAKKIRVCIPKSTPIYKYLKLYEKLVKTNFSGPFFEFTTSFRSSRWSRISETCRIDNKSVNRHSFHLRYPVRTKDGSLLQVLECTRFRKVFGSAKFLELMDGIDDAQELADKLQDFFDHDDLDTALSSYISKVPDSRFAIDISLAMVTGGKITELRYEGRIDVTGNRKGKKSVFLCECEDPSNPTHGFTIADVCKRYDLCLGCKRSIVSAKNLPYICYRIMQYEEARVDGQNNWSSNYESKWMIARDALARYINKDKKQGKRLVEEAWRMAENNEVSLPPIIMRNVI